MWWIRISGRLEPVTLSYYLNALPTELRAQLTEIATGLPFEPLLLLSGLREKPITCTTKLHPTQQAFIYFNLSSAYKVSLYSRTELQLFLLTNLHHFFTLRWIHSYLITLLHPVTEHSYSIGHNHRAEQFSRFLTLLSKCWGNLRVRS